jgi:hypothetical protein
VQSKKQLKTWYQYESLPVLQQRSTTRTSLRTVQRMQPPLEILNIIYR